MEIPCKWEGEVPKRCKYHAKWKANMAECRKYHATCKVTMSKWNKYHAKWQILVPNCCKYKADGTRKESQQKFQNLSQKQIQKLFCTHNFLLKFPNNNSNSSNYFTPPFFCIFSSAFGTLPRRPKRRRWPFRCGITPTCTEAWSRPSMGISPSKRGLQRQNSYRWTKKKCWNTIFVEVIRHVCIMHKVDISCKWRSERIAGCWQNMVKDVGLTGHSSLEWWECHEKSVVWLP